MQLRFSETPQPVARDQRFWLGHRAYWYCQLVGLSLGAGLGCWAAWLEPATGDSIAMAWLRVFVTSSLTLTITHAYRWQILAGRWKELGLRALIPRVLAGSLLCGILLATGSRLIDPGGWARASERAGGSASIVMLVSIWFSLNFVGWSLLYFGYHYHTAWEEARVQRLRLEVSAKEAALASLRAQIHPHFLFNGLNALRDLIEHDPTRARQMVTELAKLFRASLSSNDEPLVPLAAELDTVEAYLHIEKTRFEDLLDIQRSVDPAARHALLPPFLLQTLVENAVKYGMSAERSPISYEATMEDGSLVLRVRNRGSLGTATNSTGKGISMGRERLAILFDGRARLDLTEDNGEVLALARIPQNFIVA
ncbi:sensor histidine kinase [Luteolibacter luteus]|uniref:Histidine kinase n=1 Tax=Luteolibacter luteus TaxID=2728835 RepID=A0A858RMZ3_9BACT|nr:histidine kinase [Luteolibacter luteus]QJE97854.1 histidine kinase [Luteolibacter luteus]